MRPFPPLSVLAMALAICGIPGSAPAGAPQESIQSVCGVHGGLVVISGGGEVELGGRFLLGRRFVLGRRARPETIDEWSHPRHAADGNAVSLDLQIGPSRRIRWVAGPQQEISNLVSAGGRNFYAGVLARDAFNGLK